MKDNKEKDYLSNMILREAYIKRCDLCDLEQLIAPEEFKSYLYRRFYKYTPVDKEDTLLVPEYFKMLFPALKELKLDAPRSCMHLKEQIGDAVYEQAFPVVWKRVEPLVYNVLRTGEFCKENFEVDKFSYMEYLREAVRNYLNKERIRFSEIPTYTDLYNKLIDTPVLNDRCADDDTAIERLSSRPFIMCEVLYDNKLHPSVLLDSVRDIEVLVRKEVFKREVEYIYDMIVIDYRRLMIK